MYITEKIDEYLGEKKVFVSAYFSGNVLKWRTEDGRTGSDPMKKGTDKKTVAKHFKKVLGSDVELELNEGGGVDPAYFAKQIQSAKGDSNRLSNLKSTIRDMGEGRMLSSSDVKRLCNMIDKIRGK